MAESFSIKAILSATDKGFSSAMKSASGYLDNLKTTVTSGIGFGVMMAAGQKAFDTINNGVSDLIGGMNEASAAWKTFQGNMEMNGKTAAEIKSVKKELQDFAQATIYSSSDMASTYAQLEAVGTKSTTKLVKGFGGLAAAAENPVQAMKTLSQQATQMAAKPTVAWEDFKLMLEQTPAGMAAVAKQMGRTTQQLIKDVQAGTIATEDFFDAIAEVGTNDSFTKLATQYKTVGQAMDGLTETMSNKLQPAFDVLSQKGIDSIDGIINKVSELDGEKIAAKLTAGLDKIEPYWTEIKNTAMEVGSAFGDAFSAISDSLAELNGSFGSTENVENFGNAIGEAGGALKTFAGFLEEHSDTVAVLIKSLPKLLAAYMGFKLVRAVVPSLVGFTGAILGLAGKGIKGLAGKLLKVSKSQEEVGKSSSSSSKKVLTSAKAFMMMGAGVALTSGGFYLLAQSAIDLSDAGGAAIGIMIGLVGAVAALGFGMSVMLKSMTASPAKIKAFSTAMLSLGAAVLLVSAGFAILAQSSIALATAGAPAIAVMAGMVLAIAGLALGASLIGKQLTAASVGMIAFGAAVLIAGAGMYILSAAAINLVNAGTPAIAVMAGMVVALAGLMALAAVLGPMLTAGAVGFIAFGAAIVLVATGALLASAALAVVSSVLPIVAEYGFQGAAAITALALSLTAFAAGAAIAGAGIAVLGVGLVAAGAALVVVGAAAVVSAVGITAFGVAMTVGAVGVLAMSAALKAVNSSMKSIASNAKSAEKSLTSMRKSVNIVNDGLDALGSKAKSAINALINEFSNAESKAKKSGKAVGDNFKNGVESGLKAANASALSWATTIVASLMTAQSGAYSAGVYIGQGLANGMYSALGTVRSVAAQLAAAAEQAIRAKAQIHSPSKVTDRLGEYFGDGWVKGILSTVSESENAGKSLVSIPDVSNISIPRIDRTYGRDLDDRYSYGGNKTYEFIVISEIDGKQVAKATAVYTQEELDKMEKRNARKLGSRYAYV